MTQMLISSALLCLLCFQYNLPFSLRLRLEKNTDSISNIRTEGFGPQLRLVSNTCTWCSTPATGDAHLRLVLHNSDWCSTLGTCVATLRLVSHIWDWCRTLQGETFTWSPHKSSNLGGPSQSLSLQFTSNKL